MYSVELRITREVLFVTPPSLGRFVLMKGMFFFSAISARALFHYAHAAYVKSMSKIQVVGILINRFPCTCIINKHPSKPHLPNVSMAKMRLRRTRVRLKNLGNCFRNGTVGLHRKQNKYSGRNKATLGRVLLIVVSCA